MEIRPLTTLEDFQQCVDMQKEVWGFDDPYDIVPLPLLVVSERNDGIVLGAFEERRMIGFVYSLAGFHQGLKVQWSHMLAVTASHRNTDIGYRLKMEQWHEAKQKGYDVLEWTYDPLESKNAYFNLQKLGCIAKEYEINVYGITSSPLHSGTPTDRLIAHWPTEAIRKELPDFNSIPVAPALISVTHFENQALLMDQVILGREEEFLFLEIPAEMQRLKTISPTAPLEWRLKTREAFLHYFERGYVVYSFLTFRKQEPSRSFYVFKKVEG
jgi:predicted GNAT superfamily acetyltransferase